MVLDVMSPRSLPTYLDDPRNDDVLVYVGGKIFPRDQAVVSVFDNGFSMGDAIWESMRLVQGRIGFLEEHLDRLIAGAVAIRLEPVPSRETLKQAITETLRSNEMVDGANLRVMLTRGRKRTPNHDPRAVISDPTLVIIAEYKVFRPDAKNGAMALATVTMRYGGADTGDLRLKSHSSLNHILALTQAIDAGADEALMLDQRGSVASCNASNFFIVRGSELWTSTGVHCFKGITRQKVIDCWRIAGGAVWERDFSVADTMSADEAFVTETLGGVTPIGQINGRPVGEGAPGRITREIMALYEAALLAG